MAPVVAAANGVVDKFGYGPRSGYYVVISHQDGYETWYMHLNNDTPGTDDERRGAPEYTYMVGLDVGDQVVASQQLAFAGDSGNAEWTTHHTHFESRPTTAGSSIRTSTCRQPGNAGSSKLRSTRRGSPFPLISPAFRVH